MNHKQHIERGEMMLRSAESSLKLFVAFGRTRNLVLAIEYLAAAHEHLTGKVSELLKGRYNSIRFQLKQEVIKKLR